MASNSTVPETIAHLSPYNYIPTFSVGIVLLALFSVTTALHLGQALYYRLWFLLPTIVTGGFGEIVGWSARVWSSKAPLAQNPFLMQITTTIISPTFVLAANFIITGRLINRLGAQYSRLRPRMYTIIFCVCDVAALTVQAVGGAQASSASDDNNAKGAQQGGNIMLGGICFQLAAITVYSALTIEFLLRFLQDRPFPGRENTLTGRLTSAMDQRVKLLLAGLALSDLCIFIRAVYRTIELSNGWGGRIISTERYFVILDGGMIVIAMIGLNIFHPGFLMQETEGFESEKKLTDGA